jgi:RES domain-containing protein
VVDRPTSVTDLLRSVVPASVTGTFYRHAAPRRDAFAGAIGGRWGADFPVVYLGRPVASIVIEAYRHLVEDAGVPASMVRPRIQYTVPVRVTHLLDLTDDQTLSAVGLTTADLSSAVGDYSACQTVAAAAHGRGFHGLLAPAAHGRGETLALFAQKLPAAERPTPSKTLTWQRLPPDPRVTVDV